MSMSASIKNYLDKHRVPYRIFNHGRVLQIEDVAELLKIPKKSLLTTSLLTNNNKQILSVYPVSKCIDFNKLNNKLNKNFKILSECTANKIFTDGEANSLPPFGKPYGLDVILDSSVYSSNFVYFRAGSYTSIIELSINDFLYLSPKSIKCSFTTEKKNVLSDLDKKNILFHKLKKYNLLNKYKLPKVNKYFTDILELLSKDEISDKLTISILEKDGNIKDEMIQLTDKSIVNMVETLGSKVCLSLAFKLYINHIFKNNINISFWKHAFLCAEMAKNIAKFSRLDINNDLAYKLGLMHNFGFLLFAKLFPHEFKLLSRWMKINPRVHVNILEKKLLGIGQIFNLIKNGGHSQIGVELMHHWGMDNHYITVAKEHHNKDYTGQYQEYLFIIQTANQLLALNNIGDGLKITPSEEMLEKISLTSLQAQECLKLSIQAFSNLNYNLTQHLIGIID